MKRVLSALTPAPRHTHCAPALGRGVSFVLLFLALFLLPLQTRAAEALLPKPTQYVTDDARVLTPQARQRLNAKLLSYEQTSSNQILVGIYKKMPSDDDMAAYCTRVFTAWQVGTMGKDNGVVLFIFTDDRKAQITTGYGLEGALPDATAKLIIEKDLGPRLAAGDYEGGVDAAVDAMLAATRGEYQGTGGTVNDLRHKVGNPLALLVIGACIFLFWLFMFWQEYTIYTAGGRRAGFPMLAWLGMRALFDVLWMIINVVASSRGGGGGGGGSRGGGGGWSSGGGRTGGGGAGGSW